MPPDGIPPERGPVIVLDNEFRPEGVIQPCPAYAVAVLSVPKPATVYCCGIEGHEGRHYFHIEWDADRA